MTWYNPTTWFGSAAEGIKMANTLVEGAVKGMDALWYTDEEKAQDKGKVMDNYLELIKTTAGENTAKSKTRRILAIMIIGNALIMTWFTILFKLLGIFLESDKSDKAAVFVFTFLKEFWYYPVLSVVIFYFGYYAWMNIKKTKKG